MSEPSLPGLFGVGEIYDPETSNDQSKSAPSESSEALAAEVDANQLDREDSREV